MEELEKSMYYGATQSTFKKAWQLRNKMTPEEAFLWKRLKGKQVCNVRFRRQQPINRFIADFYCHAAKLIVEIDGKIHLLQKESDNERTELINDFGIDVIRFSNQDIKTDIDSVIKQIRKEVESRLENKPTR